MGNCLSSKQKKELVTISANALVELLETLEPDERISQIAKLLLTESNKKNQVVLNQVATRIANAPEPGQE